MRISLTKGSNNKGFTLVELTMVILVIGIVVTIITPRVGGMLDRQNLRRTNNAIRGMVRFAYARAALEKRDYGLIFDLERQVIATCAFDRPQTFEREEPPRGISIVGPPLDSSRQDRRAQEPTCREELATGASSFAIPDTIRILDVVSPRGEKTLEGEALTRFYRTGEADATVIHLEAFQNEKITLWIEPFTGRIQEWEGYVEAKGG